MSLVHCGVDTWVAVALLGAKDPALDTDEVLDEAGAVTEADVAGDVLGGIEWLFAPNPEVALLHPASAAPEMSTKAISCALLRIIGRSLVRRPVDFVHAIVQEASCDLRNTSRAGHRHDPMIDAILRSRT